MEEVWNAFRRELGAHGGLTGAQLQALGVGLREVWGSLRPEARNPGKLQVSGP